MEDKRETGEVRPEIKIASPGRSLRVRGIFWTGGGGRRRGEMGMNTPG